MPGDDSQREPAVPRSISVLVPVLNEEGGLEPTVTQLIRILRTGMEDFEIIIVNDGSTDGTKVVAEQLAKADQPVRLFHSPRNMGLGYCYRIGVQEARKSHFVYVPGDNTWPESSITEIFRHMGKADVVTSYAINPEVRRLARRVVSALYTRILNALFGLHMKYYNGLTIYPTKFVLSHPVTTHGFGFQAETLLKALHAGLTVVEVGVPIGDRATGKSKAVTVRNILSVVTMLVRIYWRLGFRGPAKTVRSVAPR